MAPEMNAPIGILNVVPGLHCNLECPHCVTRSGPSARGGLSDAEVAAVQDAVRRTRPALLVFTGGEPTLYTEIIERILRAAPPLPDTAVQITTNGWFARDDKTLDAVLTRLSRLDRVLLSTGRFHMESPPTERIRALKAWCDARGVTFSVSVCLGSPEDLVAAASLHEATGAEVTYTRVEACGRAADLNISFPYTSFETRVLDRFCPNRGTLTYIVGRGFSVCCANLAFNGARSGFVHETLDEHLESGFYAEVESRTLGQMLTARGKELDAPHPEWSSACSLCEHIQGSGRPGGEP